MSGHKYFLYWSDTKCADTYEAVFVNFSDLMEFIQLHADKNSNFEVRKLIYGKELPVNLKRTSVITIPKP